MEYEHRLFIKYKGRLLHRYSNEAERANWDIYDDFKLKNNNFGSHSLYNNIAAL